MIDALDREIAAFDRMKPELEQHHSGKFVVIRDQKLIGAFDTLNAAADGTWGSSGRLA
jgi:hypothetical protein